MATTSDDAMESLLCSFDQIYEEFANGVARIQSLQSNCDAELKNREALEFSMNSLKSENERLTKLYTESLNKLADQLEFRATYRSLQEELKRMNDEHTRKENEHMNAAELLKQDHASKSNDLEAQIRDLLIQKVSNEATINQLCQDLAGHRNHIKALTNRLEQVHSDVESRYDYEIQGLKDCLMLEQEEKNVLNKQVQELEKELLVARTKLVEHQRDSISNRQVEILKQKIMKLRKENDVLKRQLHGLKEG